MPLDPHPDLGKGGRRKEGGKGNRGRGREEKGKRGWGRE